MALTIPNAFHFRLRFIKVLKEPLIRQGRFVSNCKYDSHQWTMCQLS